MRFKYAAAHTMPYDVDVATFRPHFPRAPRPDRPPVRIEGGRDGERTQFNINYAHRACERAHARPLGCL